MARSRRPSTLCQSPKLHSERRENISESSPTLAAACVTHETPPNHPPARHAPLAQALKPGAQIFFVREQSDFIPNVDELRARAADDGEGEEEDEEDEDGFEFSGDEAVRRRARMSPPALLHCDEPLCCVTALRVQKRRLRGWIMER